MSEIDITVYCIFFDNIEMQNVLWYVKYNINMMWPHHSNSADLQTNIKS